MNDDYVDDLPWLGGQEDIPITAEVMKDDENLVKAIISKAEVEIIVKHYCQMEFDLAYQMQVFQTWGSAETRLQQLAQRRINTFIDSGAITAERVQAISDPLFEPINTRLKAARLRLEFEEWLQREITEIQAQQNKN